MKKGDRAGARKRDQLLTALYCWAPLPREAMGRRGVGRAGGASVSTCSSDHSGRGPSCGQLRD